MKQKINKKPIQTFYAAYGTCPANSLEECQESGYRAAFIPEIIDYLSNVNKFHLVIDHFASPSVRVTGTTKAGTPVVVYAHTDNYFSNFQNILAVRNKGLRSGAGKVPKKEFERLLDMEDGKSVFVVDYNALNDSLSGRISLSEALEHPQTIPFVGGEKRAQEFIRLTSFFPFVTISHCDDLDEVPLGRMLQVGISSFNIYGSLLGDLSLYANDDNGWGFVGTLLKAPVESEITGFPSLEQVLAKSIHIP